MTNASIGIRGISPFAGTPQDRRQFNNRGERTLAKHAGATPGDTEAPDLAEEPVSLAPGRLIDIKV
ncbi:MAG TPA: hypothetical protein VNR39_06770 [Pseudolabrys sp.]|nr:hypothetical protein [Pseudolabrys sp.]